MNVILLIFIHPFSNGKSWNNSVHKFCGPGARTGQSKDGCLCSMMLGSHQLMAPIFYSISKYGLRIIAELRNANYLVLP